MEKKPLFEELPYREALAVLRELGRNDDADFLETQIDEIMEELGLNKEEVETMNFQDIGETLAAYYLNLQNQMMSQASFDVPVSMSGKWMAGKNMPPELIERVARIQAQRMEEEKLRMGFG